ncbi:MAG: flagellar protein FlaG, partial [Gammaproteobacteria bacterium]
MIPGSITSAPPAAGTETRRAGDRRAASDSGSSSAALSVPAPAAQAVTRQPAAEAPDPRPPAPASGQELRDSAEQLARRISEQISIEKRSLAFEVNDSLGTTVVSVIDRETDEVIRQIPSEEFVRIAETIRQLNEQ